MPKPKTGPELMKALIELDTRLAYHPTIKKGDRDLLNEVINFLNHLQMVNLLKVFDNYVQTDEVKKE